MCCKRRACFASCLRVCFWFYLNHSSAVPELWFSSSGGVCVCACVCATSLCTCRAFLLVASSPPVPPNDAICDFYCPNRAFVTATRRRHTDCWIFNHVDAFS